MLNIIIPKEVAKIKQQITALEYLIAVDTNAKDKEIHQQALNQLKQSLNR